MRTAQPTRPAVRARMFWPRQPASRVPQAPANAAGRLPYVPLGCACLFLLGYLPGIWLGRTGAWEPGSQLAAYYLSKSSYSTVFSVWQWQFSAAFLQLAALYLCSFSALGCFFFPILFFFARWLSRLMRCLRTGCRGEPGPCLLLAAEQPVQSECTVCRAVAIRLQRSDKQRVVPVRLFGRGRPWAVGGSFSAADNTLSVLPAAGRNGQSGQRLAVSLPRRSPAVRACFPRYNLDPQEERLSPRRAGAPG